ncbi:esterase-like activity of phytase family protein [Hymenobacter cellulosivorans]|uniref:Esterase-like activity of phytase family protein n=1 Tax=Hymenobacter cellulosivorans TaxID=2932249 RepID=A0ABY4FGH5_9BACT|nr:esterase-like activity of phytase family protein [Hymenobacter cellulosivorans]UOQ53546.1 esterase-like activity of phytase family protein [Hymenobacter cellulosivorans]
MNKIFSVALLLAGAALPVLQACDKGEDTPENTAAPTSVASLRFIGEAKVPFRQDYSGTTLGGFSGIDYRPDNNSYYLMCDDPSNLQPVRFYTAALAFDEKSFSGVTFTSVTTLKRPDGTTFPRAGADATAIYGTIDPEGIRYDAATGHILWSSEGVRNLSPTLPGPVTNDPFLREANLDGSHVAQFGLPALFQVKATENGTRSNGSYEGLSVSPGGRFVFTAQEEPIYEDGPRAAFGVPATTRIVKYDKATRQVVGQYAYRLDAVHKAPVPATEFQLNGIVEVLALSETKLLVMERSFAVGATPDYVVKIHEVDLAAATDVSSLNGLQGASYTPVTKRLVLDLATTGIARVDNLEGMTFGPRLPNGHFSLIMVSDDNFAMSQITQFLAFEVIP